MFLECNHFLSEERLVMILVFFVFSEGGWVDGEGVFADHGRWRRFSPMLAVSGIKCNLNTFADLFEREIEAIFYDIGLALAWNNGASNECRKLGFVGMACFFHDGCLFAGHGLLLVYFWGGN